MRHGLPAPAGRRTAAHDSGPVRVCPSGQPGRDIAGTRGHPGEAKLISGGYSLLPLLKLRLAQPAVLVDLQDVPGLKGIVRTDDFVRIGSRTTHRQIQESEELAQILPIMREAAGGIGDAQVRNWGTIGGSVAHADPSSDWPAVLIATDASVVCRSVDGEREIAARYSSSIRS